MHTVFQNVVESDEFTLSCQANCVDNYLIARD